MIKVMTLNLAGINFEWFEKRREALLTSISLLSPDILFLQETTTIPESHYDQTMDIGKAIDLLHCAFAPYGNTHEYRASKLGGVAILSRWPFHYVKNVKLPPGEMEEYGARVAVVARIKIGEQELQLISTHLSWQHEEKMLRLHQGKVLMDSLTMNIPTILAGDFNATSDEEIIHEIKKKFIDTFQNDQEAPTWDLRNNYITTRLRGNDRIDFIFCSEDIHFRQTRVVLNQRAPVFPSDHFGVMTEINW